MAALSLVYFIIYFFPVAHRRKWKKNENSSGRVIIFFKSDFSLFGSFKIQMTFQTLILTELESNLRAPRSLLLWNGLNIATLYIMFRVYYII